MRFILLVLMYFSSVGDGLKKASRINEGVAQAKEYYRQQAYEQAKQEYLFLRDSLNVKDDALLLNLAHAAYLSSEVAQARIYYSQLRKNPDPELQGAALNQLGLIAFEAGNTEKALYFFRNAIIKNRLNETARYNYELVKKYQAENPSRIPPRPTGKKSQAEKPNEPKPQEGEGIRAAQTGNTDFIKDLENPGQEPPQNKLQDKGIASQDQNKKAGDLPNNQSVTAGKTPKAQGNQPGNTQGLQDNENSPLPNSFNRNGATEEITGREKQMQTLRKRLGNSDLTPEKALLLLEAMQNAELQYLQQLPSSAPPRKNKNKPDW